MANEQIVKGKAYRILSDATSKLWSKISFWSAASDVEFNDGKTAETKVGAINGITDSLASDSSNIAASAKAVNTLNSNLGGLEFGLMENGKPGWKERGADALSPFNAEFNKDIKISFSKSVSCSGGSDGANAYGNASVSYSGVFNLSLVDGNLIITPKSNSGTLNVSAYGQRYQSGDWHTGATSYGSAVVSLSIE